MKNTVYRKLKEYGMSMFDITPTLIKARDFEIKQWLEENSELHIEPFVILDDFNFDIPEMKERLVQTCYWGGGRLAEKNVQQAIDILNNNRSV